MNTTKHTGEEWKHPLFVYATNDSQTAHFIKALANRILGLVDSKAIALARERAEWHDDPKGDPQGHAESHAPADKQFPEELRKAVALELVEYYLTETKGI